MTIYDIMPLIEEIVVKVRKRILERYPESALDNYYGQCNRASMMFFVYLTKKLEDMTLNEAANMCLDIPGIYCFHDINYMVTKTMTDICAERINIKLVHGEQAHTPEIDESEWYMEHTWVEISLYDDPTIIYVDCTSGQFKYLYNDIPDYYISTEKPRWYLADRDNPEFARKD